MRWDIRRAVLFLYRCLFRRRHVTGHPFPQVTEEDVVRIVRRDFPEDQFDAAMSMLDEHGTEKWERGRPRVCLATLKLASGNLEKLKDAVRMARSDWRDVLGAAEYPERYSAGSRVRELPVREQQGIIDGDWKQYEEWLRR